MKTRVFGIIHWVIVSLNICDLLLWIISLLYGQLDQLSGGELIFSLSIMAVMMFILPIGLLIYSLLTFNNTIIIDETGVYRIRFKKVIKQFQWSEIKTIGFTSNDTFTGWVYISNKGNVKYSYCEISKMRLNPNNIYFHLTQGNRIELEEMMNKYYNK